MASKEMELLGRQMLHSSMGMRVSAKMWCYTGAVCRVESAIEKVAADLDAAASQPGKKNKSISRVKQKARTCLQEMVANVSPAFIR